MHRIIGKLKKTLSRSLGKLGVAISGYYSYLQLLENAQWFVIYLILLSF